MKPIHLDLADDGIAEISMRDEDGRNALTEGFVSELELVLDAAIADTRCRVIVLRGTSDVFCSGASKELLLSLSTGGIAPADILLPRHLLAVPLPIIAAMEGHAVSGGFAVGLCADIVLIARESRYGCNFMDLGLTPGMGTTRLLEHVLSPAVARELLFTGELRQGRQFTENGAFNYILPKPEVLPKALDVARRIAEKPRPALQLLKRTLAAPRQAAFEDAFGEEKRMHRAVLDDPVTRQRIEASYVE